MVEHMDPYDSSQELLQEEWLAERAAMRKLVTKWLREQGVLCDCDNGRRTVRSEHGTRYNEPCGRCTLVEVGGIRMRANRGRVFLQSGRVFLQSDRLARDELMLPVVRVTE